MVRHCNSRQGNDGRPNPLSTALRRGCLWISKLGKLRTNAPVLCAHGQHYPPYLPLVSVEDRPVENVMNENVFEVKDDVPSNSRSVSHEEAMPSTFIDITVDDERDDQDTYESGDDAPVSHNRSIEAQRYIPRKVRSLVSPATSTRAQTKEGVPTAVSASSQLNDKASPSTSTTTPLSSSILLSTSIDRIMNVSLAEGGRGCIKDGPDAANSSSGPDAANSSSGRDASPQARLFVERHITKSNVERTMRHLGTKVSVLSESLKVFVIHLLPPEACELIRFITEEHVNRMHAIGRSDMTYRAFYTYTEMDIPCCEIAGLLPLMDQIFVSINRIIAHVLDEPQTVHLKPRSWMEPHLLKYDHGQNHTGAIMHHDGSDFTWNLMLSHPSEYTGGGTYIRALRQTVMLRQGQVLVHPGDLFHQGLDIYSGARELVVCFLDGHTSNVKDPSSEAADSETFKTNILYV